MTAAIVETSDRKWISKSMNLVRVIIPVAAANVMIVASVVAVITVKSVSLVAPVRAVS